MPFCAQCGAQGEGNFCPACGASRTYGSAAPVGAPAQLEDNLVAALCYGLGVLTGILFLVLEPYNKNREIRFHAFQSIFAFGAIFVASACLMFLSYVPLIGMLALGLLPLLGSLVTEVAAMTVAAYLLRDRLFAAGLSLLTGREARQAARESGLYACGVVCAASYALAMIYLVRGVVVLMRLSDQIDVQNEMMMVNYSRYFAMICVLIATAGLGCLAAERQMQVERRLQKA